MSSADAILGTATNANGVHGVSNGGNGVVGTSTSGEGVYGTSTDGYGVYGVSNGGNGVVGTSTSGEGVYGTSTDGYGVYGYGYSRGIYGYGYTSDGGTASGVYGYGYSSGGGAAYGVNGYGGSAGVNGSGGTTGVNGSGGTYGSYGYSAAGAGAYGTSNNVGVWGQATAYGVYGYATDTGTSTTYGGYFKCSNASSYAICAVGNVEVFGTLSKSAGSFKIDHPLDPEHKWLSHSFVESPDMMNVYNGNVTLDGNGEASVELPDYFTVLNRDYRYQLTAIGAAGPDLHIASEVADNKFTVAGGKPGMKVSWQVTGIRQDAYAKAHPIVVEENKAKEHRGTRQFVPAGSKAKAMHLGPTPLKAAEAKPLAVPHRLQPGRRK
ncbi:hypothetical protein [uncultured Jatrophihabitans sp.]|uniref:hypothetical protein n=1 Tax=uncultured Jatrophihabitans sp. TaxID=1610747 RepID=UPI0035C96851